MIARRRSPRRPKPSPSPPTGSDYTAVLLEEMRGQIQVVLEVVAAGTERTDRLAAQMADGFRQVNAGFVAVAARFDKVDARFAAIDSRFDRVDARFEAVDARLDKVDSRFEAVDAQRGER